MRSCRGRGGGVAGEGERARRERRRWRRDSIRSSQITSITSLRALHPSPQRITTQPDKLNNFFASTAERTIGINAYHVDDYASIINLFQSLPANVDNGFQIRTVTLKEVIYELRNIRSDCSTGPDNIPANMIKVVAHYLGSPLTDAINTCIKSLYFPFAWKLARICAIPKGNHIKSEKDLRPISILPVCNEHYIEALY